MNEPAKLSRDAVGRLADRLKDECARLARDLLPGGTEARGLYRAARRSEGGPGDSLTVYLRGPPQGKWRHFGGDLNGEAFGDMLDLIRCTQQLDRAEARQWALRWLGLEPGAVEYRRTPDETANARKAAAEKYRAQMEQLARSRKSAKALWLSGGKITLDNPGGKYFAGRIPGFGNLLELGWGLHALRFVPQLKHPDADRMFPAIVAACQFGNGGFSTVHRLYLTEFERGKWDVLRAGRDGLMGKMLYCALEGGFCPLWRGSRIDTDRKGNETGEIVAGYPWHDERAGELRDGEAIWTEGLENGLSLAAVQPDRRYGAAISLPNFMSIKLPPWSRRAVWFEDDDGDNLNTPKMLDAALTRLEEQGVEVAIARPPAGFKDANAALRGAEA